VHQPGVIRTSSHCSQETPGFPIVFGPCPLVSRARRGESRPNLWTNDFGAHRAPRRQLPELPTLGHLYLPPATAPPSLATSDTSCLEAFDRELDYLFEILRRLGAGPSEVEDLAQDVFLVLHRQWSKIDTSRPLRPYLFGVAFRVVRTHRRRHRRETPYAGIDAVDEGPGPEGSVQNSEAVRLVLAALERVPLSRRAVIVTHDLDGVPIAEVARQLSLTRFGVYARLRKGRRELASAIRHLMHSPRGPMA